MQSNGAKAAVAILSVAVIVVLFVVLSGGDDDTSTTSTTATTAETTTGGSGSTETTKSTDEPAEDIPVIKIEGGQPVGGVADLEFTKGEDVKFEVTTDGDEGEIHVHGYDIPQEFENGKTVFDFPADIDGVFEVEIEDTAVPIAELTVNP